MDTPTIEARVANGAAWLELPARFRAKIEPNTDGCWIWTAYRNGAGYACVGVGHQHAELAHRVVYEMLAGSIPNGLQLDHLCRVRSCVNPAHLEPVTAEENVRRAVEARTHCKYGHEFTEENTQRRAGTRLCRTCRRGWERERYWRNKEVAA